MNVVLLVGRVSDRPFRPGNAERLVVRIDVPSPRKAGHVDELEVNCFGAVATSTESNIRLGDHVEVRGRIEHRIGRDDQGEYDDFRIVAEEIIVPSTKEAKTTAPARGPHCDGSQCADMVFVDGTVKGFRTAENYGFIETGNLDKDVFFSGTDVHGTVMPKPGDLVRFVLETRKKGPGASHVSLIDAG